MRVNDYFATARERYRIKQKKELGKPWPWTEDKIFQTWNFCNVHREDDRTTVWFKENIRNNSKNVVLATFIFRLFNKIETGEIIKDLLVEDKWETTEAYNRLKDVKPLVTGSYVNLRSLSVILDTIEQSREPLKKAEKFWGSYLETAYEDLQKLPTIGKFMAYEIVTDLRHTPVLYKARDVNTWANLGPGSSRGLEEVAGQKITSKKKMALMRDLLQLSRDKKYWPQEFKYWELREAEHWACEFYKYSKVQKGFRQKRRYNAPKQG